MRRYELYVFDLDGTLYRGVEAIPNAVKVVSELKAGGAEIRYLTNNSGNTSEFFRDKLARMGFPVKLSEVYSSGVGAATYLCSESATEVFVVGEAGLVETLRSRGLKVVNAREDNEVGSRGGQSNAVLVGICRKFDYALLNEAMQRVRAGNRFVATNTDATYPVEGHRLVPGAGSMVSAVETCSGRSAFVVGKPNPYLVELVLAEAGIEPVNALVVGDRMETDIESGRRAACPTHLVLTGVTPSPVEGQSWSLDLTALI